MAWTPSPASFLHQLPPQPAWLPTRRQQTTQTCASAVFRFAKAPPSFPPFRTSRTPVAITLQIQTDELREVSLILDDHHLTGHSTSPPASGTPARWGRSPVISRTPTSNVK